MFWSRDRAPDSIVQLDSNGPDNRAAAHRKSRLRSARCILGRNT
jgi:hypothetical protein